jgi:hypothetical protein
MPTSCVILNLQMRVAGKAKERTRDFRLLPSFNHKRPDFQAMPSIGSENQVWASEFGNSKPRQASVCKEQSPTALLNDDRFFIHPDIAHSQHPQKTSATATPGKIPQPMGFQLKNSFTNLRIVTPSFSDLRKLPRRDLGFACQNDKLRVAFLLDVIAVRQVQSCKNNQSLRQLPTPLSAFW